MQRRAFIHLSAYTAIALTLPLMNGCAPDASEKAIAQPSFFSHLVDVKTISETGQAYRKLIPSEDNKHALTSLLLGNVTSKDKKSIQKLLDDRVEQDFKRGKTITTDGWILSVTEARQCALFSILNS